jgi:transcriptional regulator with XRE-family HTH domain
MFNKFFVKSRLRQIRESRKLSRPQIFKKTGILIDTLVSWEVRNNCPSLEQLYKIANYYNVSLDYIACRTENPEVNK